VSVPRGGPASRGALWSSGTPNRTPLLPPYPDGVYSSLWLTLRRLYGWETRGVLACRTQVNLNISEPVGAQREQLTAPGKISIKNDSQSIPSKLRPI